MGVLADFPIRKLRERYGLMYFIESLPNGPRMSEVILEVRPIVAFRDHHALMQENDAVDDQTVVKGDRVRIRPYDGMPSLTISMGNGRFERSFYWYRSFHYRREKESGYPHREDLFSPGRLAWTATRSATPALRRYFDMAESLSQCLPPAFRFSAVSETGARFPVSSSAASAFWGATGGVRAVRSRVSSSAA